MPYFGAERIEKLCLEEFRNSNWFEVFRPLLRFAHFCIQCINLIVFNFDGVDFVECSFALELNDGLVEEKCGNVVTVIIRNRITYGIYWRQLSVFRICIGLLVFDFEVKYG